MQIEPTKLDGVLIFETESFADQRGTFREIYRKDKYQAAGVHFDFVQQNQSRSAKGVLRGLHYQEPMAQAKLVQVVHGAVFDVAVDIRRGSPQFGRWVGVELSDVNHRQLLVPPGFAHGFLSLAEDTDVIYQCSEYYAPRHEHTLLWNDPSIGIVWPTMAGGLNLSPKDAAGHTLDNAPALPIYKKT